MGQVEQDKEKKSSVMFWEWDGQI